MARHNVIFGRDKEFHQGSVPGFSQQSMSSTQQQGWTPYQGGAAQQPGPAQQTGQYGQQASPQDLEAVYARPSATGHDTGRMTMRDALNAITATLGIIIVVGAAVMFTPVVLGLVAGPAGAELGQNVATGALLIGLIGGLVTGLINAFKRQPSPILVLLYAVFEGLLLGGISRMFEGQAPGIAFQAMLATFAVAATVLIFFRMGILRTSARLNKIFMIAMIAYLGFCLVSIGSSLIFGESLRGGVPGLIIGAIAVVLGAYSLVMDFEEIQGGVDRAPRVFAWRAAFGVASTLVWMYIEILRILSILRGGD